MMKKRVCGWIIRLNKKEYHLIIINIRVEQFSFHIYVTLHIE